MCSFNLPLLIEIPGLYNNRIGTLIWSSNSKKGGCYFPRKLWNLHCKFQGYQNVCLFVCNFLVVGAVSYLSLSQRLFIWTCVLSFPAFVWLLIQLFVWLFVGCQSAVSLAACSVICQAVHLNIYLKVSPSVLSNLYLPKCWIRVRFLDILSMSSSFWIC